MGARRHTDKTARMLVAGMGVLIAVLVVGIAGAPASAEPAPPDLPASGEAYLDGAYVEASAGCGRICDGKDPERYKIYHSGCSTCYHYCADDADTVSLGPRSGSPQVWVHLRYSPRCRTVWARATAAAYYPEIRSYYLDGRLRTTREGNIPGGYYTQMLDDKNLLGQACASTGPSTACSGTY